MCLQPPLRWPPEAVPVLELRRHSSKPRAMSPLEPSLPSAFWQACRRLRLLPTPWVLVVSVPLQRLLWYRRLSTVSVPKLNTHPSRSYSVAGQCPVSTSKFGTGQLMDSCQTPLGLHRVGVKIGAGWPIGTVFRARKPVGFTWQGFSDGSVTHRILWLEGLEEGCNRGGRKDTFSRYIYIHGFPDESTIGRPASHGCVHLRAKDLLPLFDGIPINTLVWITNSIR